MNNPGKTVECPSCQAEFLESRAYKLDYEYLREYCYCPSCNKKLTVELKGPSIRKFHYITAAVGICTYLIVWFLINQLVLQTTFFGNFNPSSLLAILIAVFATSKYRLNNFPYIALKVEA
ncbi:hypothetical protein [Pseudoalteromonas distincta]|uniref:DUF971 domain-containing protein n=1 Tax=Pseudoalteromonas distincta TaxID=77608 RepID=A0A4P9J0F9_9GAMM|nr:hypothetical protein [Pseudoalteromonas distincta]QCU74044.1 DUF971 domain-containing protein [Pseudoalteromonas distincta]|tara:strand:- start:76239 stop:76598 length:360 start_codon:yes stop_codon:yes gene_type:complete